MAITKYRKNIRTKKSLHKKAQDKHIKSLAKSVIARQSETKVWLAPGNTQVSAATFPFVFPLAYGLDVGSLQNQRVGDSIQLTGCSIKGFARINSVKTISANFYSMLCWASIKVSPPNTNGNTPNGTYSDYMKVGPSTGIMFNRPDTDKVTPIRIVKKQFRADSTLSDQILKFDFYHRFNRKIQFLSDSGVGWLKDKQLYFVVMTDDPDIKVVFESRVYFKDN